VLWGQKVITASIHPFYDIRSQRKNVHDNNKVSLFHAPNVSSEQSSFDFYELYTNEPGEAIRSL
jgi:hypothetical protein